MERKQQFVWAPHPIEGYVLGHISDVGADSLTIEAKDHPGHSITALYEDIYPALAESFDKEVEDNCSLLYLNEATLLHNIHQRYKKDLIYSYVANILLAVNPYKNIPNLYSLETAKKYKGKSLGILPPHVFAIADKVYRDLRAQKQSQSIIVSGESGAGKTETTKFILQYLTQVYGAAAGIVEQRIVGANPLLESFGNAKTLRNDNSSRFGKFVEIHFDAEFKVVGGHVSHYLLEKSRVCFQMEQERNYHIFYYMLAGAPPDMRQTLGLDPRQSFLYLNRPTTSQDSTPQDKENFDKLIKAMDNIGMTAQEKADLFRVTAAVLHLGNILFEDDTSQKGGSIILKKSENSLVGVANLLAIGVDDLRRCLTSRVMTTTKKGTIGTIINVPLKPDQASHARDALSKALYLRLFDWIIKRVNNCFPFITSRYYIGVLDIAGFEYYQFNSFEQFCINYCNEKLQQLFNERVLKEEQELYKREGLGISTVRYIDNQDCIDLIEANTVGIIDLLDEECRLPKGSNEHFTTAVHIQHKGHFRLQFPRQSRLSQHRALRDEEGFIIRHFAGAVCYKTTGFLDKNNDALHGSLEQLLATSTDQFIQNLFPSSTANHSKAAGSFAKKLTLESVSSKFKVQLKDLVQKLRATGTSFIRCLKPNMKMEPGIFVGGQVLSQLQCAGMVAVLKLMEEGYPSRTHFIDLYNMYKSILPVKLVQLDPRTFCETLFHAVGVREREFKFGQNKVFFKAGKFAEFDQVMQSDPEKLSAMVAKVQKWLICKQWRKVIYGAISVQKLIRKIQYRQENALIIQCSVRMLIAVKKYRPRYQGIMNLRHLKDRVNTLSTLAQSLKTDQLKIVAKVTDLKADIDKQMDKLKMTSISKEQIDKDYNELVNRVEMFMTEIQSRQEQERVEEEEREKMRMLREMQKEEQRKREEEAERIIRKKAEEEKQKIEEKKRREEEDRIYKEEKKLQEEADRLLGEQLQREENEADLRQAANREQERRDFEIALRLAQTEHQSQYVITEQMKAQQKRLSQQQQLQRARPQSQVEERIVASIKDYDLRMWKFAQLRDTINTSCDIKLLEACKSELHRRLQVYHSWRDGKTHQTGLPDERGSQRIPQNVVAEANGAYSLSRKVLEMSDKKHRYFKVPFIYPSSTEQLDKKRGWWYAHFDGPWIARQLELHPEQPPLILIAGVDDMEMCELRLEETGLTRKKGAEITEEQFEEMWKKCGGKPYSPPSTQL